MKCEKCKYCQYDWSDDMYLCCFGWEDEDSKGNCGCRYNQKTLDKKYKTLLEEEQKGTTEFYEDFCKFMELKQMNLNDNIEILINDNVLKGKITDKSTRETDREYWESYHIELENEGWSILITHIKDKQDD